VEKTAADYIKEYFEIFLQYFKNEGIAQLSLLAVTLFAGYLIYLLILRQLQKWVSSRPASSSISTGYKWIKRILLPTILSLTLIIANEILNAFHVKADILGVIAPIALSMAFIRLFVYLLRKTLSPGPLLKTFENFISYSIWIVVTLYLLGWLSDASKILDTIAIRIGENRFSLLTIIKLLIYTSVFIFIALYASRIIEKQVKSKSLNLPLNVQVGALKVAKLLLYIIAVLVALNSVGIDLTIFTVLSGAIGVGVGFGLQKIASNYISGFILIMDKSIKPGDVISIDQQIGWVEKLMGRYVVVRDRDGIETLIPNETLVTSKVINWSYGDKKVRIKIRVQVSYDSDPKQCLEIILSCTSANRRVLTSPEPVARLMDFGDNGITLELRVWIEDPENGLDDVKTDIYLAIWDKFKENSIIIPFPQRDVHIKNQ